MVGFYKYQSEIHDRKRPNRQPEPSLGALQDCLLSVLKRLAVPFSFTDGECDQAALALAIQLRCPIMSKDSDFFIRGPYWSEVEGFCFLLFDKYSFDKPQQKKTPCCPSEASFFKNLIPDCTNEATICHFMWKRFHPRWLL